MRLFISLLFVLAIAVSGCAEKAGDANNNTTVDSEALASAQVVKVKVEGMTCGGCSSSIETALASQDGVLECTVDLDSKTASVKINPDKIDGAAIVSDIERQGYTASLLN